VLSLRAKQGDRGSDRREGRDDRRDRYRDRDSGPPVVGMGDHVPDFILRSFKIAEAVADPSEEDFATNAAEG